MDLFLQEYAYNVISEHKKTVQYKSTDMVMKEEEFVNICKKVVTTDVVKLVEITLIQENRVGKVSTDTEHSVVKFAPPGDCRKPVTITEVDIGIVRYMAYSFTCGQGDL